MKDMLVYLIKITSLLFIGRYEMELHLVHTNTRGDIAVIGVLYKLGAADPFLAQVIRFSS